MSNRLLRAAAVIVAGLWLTSKATAQGVPEPDVDHLVGVIEYDYKTTYESARTHA